MEQLLFLLLLGLTISITGLGLITWILRIAGIRNWRLDRGKKKEKEKQEDVLPLPPGRMGLPFLGETMQYLGTQRAGRPWAFFDERVGRHGDTFRTSLVTSATAVLASPAGNKLAFASVHTSWPASVVAVVGPESLIGATSAAAAARIRAALAHSLLRPEALHNLTPLVDRIVSSSFFSLRDSDFASELSIFPFMKKLTFGIACESLVGRPDPRDHDSLLLPFHTMMKGILQIPLNLPGTRYRNALLASDSIRRKLQPWIDEARRKLDRGQLRDRDADPDRDRDRDGDGDADADADADADPDHNRRRCHHDILSSLLRFTDERGLPLSDKCIADNLILLLFASHDSTSAVTTMACKYLAAHPAIMDAVHAENKEIADGCKAADQRGLKWGDVQRMKLSWRVVQESMRLMPPVQGVFRAATHETSFNGYRIPKSWKIMWTPHSTQRNPKYFPDPDKFDPSRFEGAGPAPFTFVPFGGGPRMCPGNEFARMEILIILHHLVTRFSWTPVDPNEPIIVDPMPFPVNGLPVLLHPR